MSLASFDGLDRRKNPGKNTLSTWQKSRYPESWIELNLKNIGWNLYRIRQLVKKPVLAVIKANAYGHGLEEVAKYLDHEGIDGLMVCKLQEAVRLRRAGVSCSIFNFGPFFPEYAEDLLEYDITQFISSPGVKHLNRSAQKHAKKARIHIHVDTGMNRMGISFRTAVSFIKDASRLDGIRITGLSTTLTEDEEYDKILMDRFLSVFHAAEKDGVELGRRHMASSAGILTSRAYDLDMVRPGIVLYGCYPNQKTSQEDRLSLKPALEFKTRVAAVKSLRPGDSVSYHRAFVAQKKEKIAVLPVGYSDGYPQGVASKGSVLIKGKKLPVVARISANHTEVLLKQTSTILPGDEAILIGSQGEKSVTADEVAAWAGISNYKVLIGLNPSLPRRKS